MLLLLIFVVSFQFLVCFVDIKRLLIIECMMYRCMNLCIAVKTCDNVYIKCYCLHAYIGLDVISLNINRAEKALTCVHVITKTDILI